MGAGRSHQGILPAAAAPLSARNPRGPRLSLLHLSFHREFERGIRRVQRGVQQSCTLGYWAGERHAGRGHVTAAVRALIPFVFEELKLHRLQAACLPENERSRAVLRKCGFTEEGIARGYLRINGAWCDHVVFAILRDDRRG